MVSLWPIAVQLHKYAGPVLTLVYPLYASVTALESPVVEDDSQWLTYWVLYSFLQLVELGFERILVWVPLWYTFKLVGAAWLVLPQIHGAEFVYNNYVKKYIVGQQQHPTLNKKLSMKERELIDQMSPEARASVAAFISEFGPGAFDSMMATIRDNNRKRSFPSSPTTPKGSPPAAQPTPKSPSSPRAAQPTKYTGSPTSRYTGSPSSRPDKGVRKTDSFRDSIKQPVRLLKTGLHKLDSRRHDIRAKMGTHAVT